MAQWLAHGFLQFSDRLPDKDGIDGLLSWSISICGRNFQFILTPCNIKQDEHVCVCV